MYNMFNTTSWPFIEAKNILERIGGKTPEKGYVLFETGYGPSGLPHIGTFGEVARTTMVRNAFREMSDIPTKLFAFSDDMDGLRRVPDNIPNQDMVRTHLGKPLSAIPDPYGEKESYAANMNNRLCMFLDQFGFEYEFKSATKCYKEGLFDQALIRALECYDKIMEVMLPTLGDERQATYSPFLPICPETGIVLQVPLESWDPKTATISYKDPRTGELRTTLVTGGNCKLQWKADWAMRWYMFDVNYEMYGKDLIPTAELSTKICQIMGRNAPVQMFYELFLDNEGKKISKSKGNGISMDDWLRYAPTESLGLYMYNAPRKAKKLYFDVIPKQVDEYITFIGKYEDNEKKHDNPVWHIHSGNPKKFNTYGLSFALLLNLASVCNSDDPSVLWGFISKYAPDANPQSAPFIDMLVKYAINYYNDFIKPNKIYRNPDENEIKLLGEVKAKLQELGVNATTEEIQSAIYELGKASHFEGLPEYFKALYQILLGQNEGPRLGSFIALYGVNEFIKLIDNVITK